MIRADFNHMVVLVLGFKRFCNTGNGADVPQYVEPPVIPGHEFSGRVRLYLFTETGKFSFSNWCLEMLDLCRAFDTVYF